MSDVNRSKQSFFFVPVGVGLFKTVCTSIKDWDIQKKEEEQSIRPFFILLWPLLNHYYSFQ